MVHSAAERNSNKNWLPPWTRVEHEARYDFGATFVLDKLVVDCACGTGIGSLRFVSKGATEVRAIDASVEAVAEARQANPPANLQINLGDATQTNLPDEFADVFISFETIEHLQDDRAFVEEAFRVLKPGGILICSTPNREITNPGTSIDDSPWNSFHVREYNLQEFRRCLESRFEVEDVYGQNPEHSSYARLRNALVKIIGTAFVIRINKLIKCRWFIFPSPGHHAVRQVSDLYNYEFYILVCRRRGKVQ